jgi:hypothetical protein
MSADALLAAIAAVDPGPGPTEDQTAAILAAAEAMMAGKGPIDLTTPQNEERIAGLWRTLFTTHGIERGYATLQRMSWGHAKDTPVRSQSVHQFLDPARGKYLNVVQFGIEGTDYRGLHYARAQVRFKPEQPDTFFVQFKEFEFAPTSDTPAGAFRDLVAGADGGLVFALPEAAPEFGSPVAYLDDRFRFMRGSDNHFYVLQKIR